MSVPWATQQRRDLKWYEMHVNKRIALHLHIDYFTHIYETYCTTLHGKTFASALEIGPSDTGGYLAVMPGIRKRVGIDPAVDLLRKIDMLPLSHHIRYIQGFAEEIPFKKGSFPLVIASNAIDHVKDMEKSAEEIYRVLRKDGYLLLATFLKVKNPHPFTFQSGEDVKQLFNKLTVVEEHTVVDRRPFTRRNDAYIGIFQKQ